MTPLIRVLAAGLLPLALALGQSAPQKTTVCELAKNPAAFDGKLIQVRAAVDTGVQDLPSGILDESCTAAVKFYAPDDNHFARLAKSKGFQKLVKAVKKYPSVEATITGVFKSEVPAAGPKDKPAPGLALESVEDVTIHHPPRAKGRPD